ncbi:hypothetical protein KO02_10215 [Sphingobacterium sp. ML3W]|uniref:hypothetical protein n=1 Tax=Sphingobacterium sp. ML3W TaxID=1538644 RepID=UPI0004F925C7|nr:hypothetical protein [Sphingobacterium sp. ML3W]AIM37026.1 hypothetical protein KO02_10215 [Sphingobacterium sp. ML3W]
MRTVPPIHTIIAFKSFVPRTVRILLFLVFAFIFQFSNTAYLTLTGTFTGVNQLLKEDLNFLYQMTMVGVCFIYPLLFRFKLRFTSQQLIIGCSIVVIIMMYTMTVTDAIPILALASFFIGAAKMLGTFETLVSIQLIITPNKDYGVFFSVALGIVLLSGQISGITAIGFNYGYDWKAIYYIMIALNALMILLVLLLLRHTRLVKKFPLYGIDWWGYFLWSSLFTAVTYLFTYGQVLDWFHSEKIRSATWLSLVFAILVIIRMFTARRPYIKARVFAIKSVHIGILMILLLQPFLSASGTVLGSFTTRVLQMDDINTGLLNWWIALGILIGAIFSYYWFLKINGPFKVFFIIAFSSLTCSYMILYFVLGSYGDMQFLIIPYLLRGFGNMLLFAGVGKYVTRDVGLDIFTQVLCYLAMARNALGSLIPSSLIAYAEYWRTRDYHYKISSKIDNFNQIALDLYQGMHNKSISGGSSTAEASIAASKALFSKINQQAVLLAGREIFGLLTCWGIAVILLLLSIHFGKPFIRQIPTWKRLRIVLSKMYSK